MKQLWGFLMMGLVVSFVGCASTSLVPRIAFPVDEYAALPTTGTGVVEGQAFMKTRGGEVRTAAGNEIHMDPVTTYSTQMYEVIYLQGLQLTLEDPKYREYFESVDWGPTNQGSWFSDAEGEFKLENIPPGEYYIMTNVTWEAPVTKTETYWDPYTKQVAQRPKTELEVQGGLIMKRIEVKNGETTIIMLTD